MEFGLPYVADAGITRHVAAFLARHEELAREALGKRDLRSASDGEGPAMPDAVLFNGGVFGSPLLRERMRGVLGSWRGELPILLENDRPELAVARGAVAYGLARRGLGLRIGGGSARSYFLLVDRGDEGAQKGICILPRGSEEGEEVALAERTFQLRVGRPVRFHVASTTADVEHVRAGQLVSIDDPERYQTLPPIAAVLTTEDEAKKEVPVSLVAQLTEIGTLEVGCVHTETGKRWQLELSLRGGGGAGQAQRVGQLHSRFAEATALVDLAYGKPKKGQAAPQARDIKRLRVDLEKVLGPRESWDMPLLRELFGALLAGMKRRRRSSDHERIWFHLVGWSMRPGFGYPLDEWRVEQLAPVLEQGVQFAPEAQNWSEFWILWRRLAGGLPPKMQEAVLDQITFYLQPPLPGRKKRKRPDGPKMLGYDDMVRLAGALERVPRTEKPRSVGGWSSASTSTTRTRRAGGRSVASAPGCPSMAAPTRSSRDTSPPSGSRKRSRSISATRPRRRSPPRSWRAAAETGSGTSPRTSARASPSGSRTPEWPTAGCAWCARSLTSTRPTNGVCWATRCLRACAWWSEMTRTYGYCDRKAL